MSDNQNRLPGRRNWRIFIVAGASAAVLAGGAGVATVMASDAPGLAGHVVQASWGGRGGQRFVERRFERFIDGVDATDEQEQRLRAIFDEVRSDFAGMREDMQGIREEVVNILSGETIDREAAERLRAERAQALDRASRRLTQALLDAAEVLTPEQRSEIADRIGEHRGRGRW